jgi:hypothetical protein
MADTAAHLVDHVLPHAPVRQWVLSFPFRIRFLLASSPRLCAAVRGIFTRTLLGWLEQRALAADDEGSTRSRSTDSAPAARREPELAARSGAGIFAQRFGSALNLNLHVHALLLDRAFVSPSERLAPRFQPAAPLTDAEVAELVEQLARRITRYLERRAACRASTRPSTVTSRPRTRRRSSNNCAPRRSKAAPRSRPRAPRRSRAWAGAGDARALGTANSLDRPRCLRTATPASLTSARREWQFVGFRPFCSCLPESDLFHSPRGAQGRRNRLPCPLLSVPVCSCPRFSGRDSLRVQNYDRRPPEQKVSGSNPPGRTTFSQGKR